MVDFDYAIVGAGAVGCVLVNRLSEDPDNQILLPGYGGGGHEPHAPGKSERSRMTSGCHRYERKEGL